MLLLIEGFILSPMNNEQLRINLMVDYVDWVDRDYAVTINDGIKVGKT
jgi:hypothetical protein